MPRISQETIDAVNQRADLVAIVSEYTKLERRGSDYWGCCPFHNERSPSFHVRPEEKMYKCFGCGAAGGVIKFVMEKEKLEFAEAVETLAKKSGVEIAYVGGFDPSSVPRDNTKDLLLEIYDRVSGTFRWFFSDSPQGARAREYLSARKVAPEMLEKFKIGYAPADPFWLHGFLRKKGYSDEFLEKTKLFTKANPRRSFFADRVMFPVCDRKGRVVAFSGRVLPGSTDERKYLNSPELDQFQKKETLFGFSLARQEIIDTKSIIVCEGNLDALAWHQSGVSRAVATLGTAFSEQHASLIRPLAQTVYLCFDSDTAGQNATFKTIVLCRKCNFDVRVIEIKGGKDPAEILNNEGPEALKKLLDYSIIDLDYLIMAAGTRFSMGSPEGISRAAAFLFPYLEALESDIQRESTFNRLSSAFGISEKALVSDFLKRNQARPVTIERKTETTERPKEQNIKKSPELRTVLAVAANTGLFPILRSSLSSDDFEDPVARDLFIVLEECYRTESASYESLMARCPNDALRELVTEAVMNGEFSANARKIIEDGANLVNRRQLERKKARIVARLNLVRGTTPEEISTMQDMLAEKQSIDNELGKLKDINE